LLFLAFHTSNLQVANPADQPGKFLPVGIVIFDPLLFRVKLMKPSLKCVDSSIVYFKRSVTIPWRVNLRAPTSKECPKTELTTISAGVLLASPSWLVIGSRANMTANNASEC
jgi:hypothetical protein